MDWIRLHSLKAIVVILLALEFIGVSTLTIMMVPPRMMVGRVLMVYWVISILVFAAYGCIKGGKSKSETKQKGQA